MTEVGLQTPALAGRISVGSIVSQALGLLGTSLGRGALVWLVGLVLVTGTDLVDLVYSPPGAGHAVTPLMMASLVVRIAAILFIPAAALRVMLPSRSKVWALDGSFWTFAIVTLAIQAATFGLAIGAMVLSKPYVAALSGSQSLGVETVAGAIVH